MARKARDHLREVGFAELEECHGKERAVLYGMVADKGETAGRFAAPEEYVGYEVLDARYQRIGRAEELVVNAGGELEYVRVRVGLLGLRSALIPVRAVWVNRRRRILMLHKEWTQDRRMAEPPTE